MRAFCDLLSDYTGNVERDKCKSMNSKEQGRADTICDTEAQDQRCDKIKAKVDEI